MRYTILFVVLLLSVCSYGNVSGYGDDEYGRDDGHYGHPNGKKIPVYNQGHPEYMGNDFGVKVVTSSSESVFDGPKISAMNSTAFDWWYFDAATADGQSSIQVTFYRTVSTLFVGLPVSKVQFIVNWPNGTTVDLLFNASSSTVTTKGYGASGIWTGSGVSFSGAPDLSQYTITVNNDLVQGSFSIYSFSRAQYPNGAPPGSVASTVLAPGLGWVNAIPAGVANCHFIVKGSLFKFPYGFGYHDKNWSGLTLPTIITSYYWGHATVGPYSYVYFDIISKDSARYSSAYLITNDGKIILTTQNPPFASSSNFAIVVPFGNGTLFPASNNDSLPTGFMINFVVGTVVEWSFLAQAKQIAFSIGAGLPVGYTRWFGKVSGGKVGGSIGYGSGVWEWFRAF